MDILSGSYSRQDQDMAGLFQVLYGQKDKTFKAATALNGKDAKPLILPKRKAKEASEDPFDDAITDVICTRPFAADLDGDGHLDIISGNFTGTFGWFRGEGKGVFQATATWLMAGDQPMRVGAHSDPCLVDWDKDGDLDLISGDADGKVTLFRNLGSKTAPKFAAGETLVSAARGAHGPTESSENEGELAEGEAGEGNFTLGDAHLKRPGGSARVWVDDIDGDGKLDLLIGDAIQLYFPVAGVDPKTIPARYAAWRKKLDEVFSGEQSEDDQDRIMKAYEAIMKERDSFVIEKSTGTVWLLRQK